MKVPTKLVRGLLTFCLMVQLLLIPAFAAEDKPVYLALGDSISSGYGLDKPKTEGFVYQIAASKEYSGYELINKSVSGYTAEEVYDQLTNPENPYYVPEDVLASADLITFTCGGNDMMNYMYDILVNAYNATGPEVPITDRNELMEIVTKDKDKAISVLSAAMNANVISDDLVASEGFVTALDSFESALTDLMRYIREKNPTASVIVATQYHPYRAMSYIFVSFIRDAITPCLRTEPVSWCEHLSSTRCPHSCPNTVFCKDHPKGEDPTCKKCRCKEPLCPNRVCTTAGCSGPVSVRTLNSVLIDNAQKLGYGIADVYTAFDSSSSKGTDLCNAYFDNIYTFDLDFHPNAAGHKVIANTFLALEHKYETVVTPPTCTEQGYTARACSICGHSTLSDYVPATGHKYSAVVTAPTCVAKGYTTHTCSACGDSYVDSYTDTVDHTYGSWTQDKAPTCTEKGSEKRVCQNCTHFETRELNALGHNYTSVVTPPTCVAKGYTTHTCPACGDSYVDSYTDTVDHSFGSWTKTKAPTCFDKGTETRTCKVCSHAETREVPALGHKYTNKVTAPTCTEKGYTTHTCSGCGDSYVDTYINTISHSFGDWHQSQAPTCTEKGTEKRTCKNCSTFETRELAALGHSYTAKVTAPTCTEKGFTTHTCSACDNSYKDTYVNAVGHNFGDWTYLKAPTCTEVGTEQRSCKNCDHSETREAAALGHSYTAKVTAPTCTERGFTTHICSVCDDSYADTYVNAVGHNFSAWTYLEAPTCTEAGTEQRTCKTCDHSETREAAALGHSYTAKVTAPTCTERGYTSHTCSVCNDSYADTYVNAVGHSFSDWTYLKAPTCTEAGTEQRTCKNCDHSETREAAALGHSYAAKVTTPTCTERGYTTHTCSVCDDSYIGNYTDALGHDYESVVTAPTCTEMGYTTYTCSACDDSYVDNHKPALGHIYPDEITPSTVCTVCGSSYVDNDEAHHYTSVVTEPTCTTKGYTTYTCSACGDSYISNYVDILSHSYDAVVTEPTCTAKGYTTYTCSACGDSYVDNYTDTVAHSFGDWTQTTAPTCTTTGSEKRTCLNCTHFEIREVAALDHSYGSAVTEPTCTTKGYTTYTCSVCGDSYVDNYTNTVAHSFGDWIQTTAPTCTTTGSEKRTCLNCTHFEVREVTALGHSYDTVVTAPTCTEAGYTTYTCSACGDSHTDNLTAAAGHNYKAAVTAPTCTEGGYSTFTCAVCDDSYVGDYTDAAGHSWDSEVKNGKLYKECSVCHEKGDGCEVKRDGQKIEIDLSGRPETLNVYAARFENGRVMEIKLIEVTKNQLELIFDGTVQTGNIKIFFLGSELLPWLNAVDIPVSR